MKESWNDKKYWNTGIMERWIEKNERTLGALPLPTIPLFQYSNIP
jgi:hypothetical protein